MTFRARSLLALLCALAPACGPATITPDVAVDALDAADSPLDAPAPMDSAPDAPACNGPEVEDLEALGTREGITLRYTTQNRDTPPLLSDALQPGSACEFRAIRQRLFRYTLRERAALRVSTDNLGTSSSFDSTLFVAQMPCTLPPVVLACNDDTPFGPATPHRTSSLLTTPVLPEGTTVLISVAGFYPAFGSGQAADERTETGNFELSVQEMSPLLPDDPCDPRGESDVCLEDHHCVADAVGSPFSHCRADGASPGARCASDGTCTAPLACDTARNVCYETISAGGTCDRLGDNRRRCAPDHACLSSVRGAQEGRCVPQGSAPQTPCGAEESCAEGLRCRNGTCLRTVAADGPCNTLDSVCPTGQSCVALSHGATVGQCRPDGSAQGSACRADATECDAPLFCIAQRWGDRTCRTVGRAPGDACGPLGACSFDTECVIFDPTQPSRGACTPAGTEGGVCRGAAPFCDTGLTCTDTTTPTRGRCLRTAAAGQACDTPGKRVRCASGTRCVRQGTTGLEGVCRASGTAAGAACRSSGTRCDSGLLCSTDTGSGTCQRNSSDGTCDARFATVACPTGTVCRAESLDSGHCVAPLSEVEPNESLPAPLVATPAVIQGILGTYDVDCVGLNVPAGGSVFAQAQRPDGTCGIKLALDLYAPSGAVLGSDTDSGPSSCPRIEGAGESAFAWARALPAGHYTVCVREASDRRPVLGYVLSVSVQ